MWLRQCVRRLGKRSVILCLSGGVDSAVSAAIAARCIHTEQDIMALRCPTQEPPSLDALIKAVYDGIPMHELLKRPPASTTKDSLVAFRAVFMKNWRAEDHEPTEGVSGCDSTQLSDMESACATVDRINRLLLRGQHPIHLSVLDFSAEYQHRCMSPLLASYAAGGTCNVDVLCNSQIKFGALLAHVTQHVGHHCMLISGHYARTLQAPPLDAGGAWTYLTRPWTWCSGVDKMNDQTHYLAELSQHQLNRAVFPLGVLVRSKADVRRAATAFGLHDVANKKTSTGLCFVSIEPRTSKSRSGAFPFWLRSRLEENHERHMMQSETPAHQKNRRTRWMVLENDAHGDECVRDITQLVKGLHADQRDDIVCDESTPISSYMFTLGERLHIKIASGAATFKIRRYYVAKKMHHSLRSDANVVATLSIVLLVASHSHSVLLERCPRLERCTLVPSISESTNVWIACRHHDQAQPCEVVNAPQLPADGTVVVRILNGGGVRCATAGQLAVLYSDAVPGITSEQPSLVVGCGWIC